MAPFRAPLSVCPGAPTLGCPSCEHTFHPHSVSRAPRTTNPFCEPDGSLTTYAQSAPGPTSIVQKITDSPLTTRTTAIQYFTTSDARKGKAETITDPRGKVTTMAYNATTGDLTSVTDPLGYATTFGYDESPSPAGRGLRTSVTDALGHVTRTVYEGRGRVKKVINHDDTFTEFATTRQAGDRRLPIRSAVRRGTSMTSTVG